ncbi:hypothetical protein ED733_007276 [Metarhizium rileyi]|uniref:Uncharacterized protein n=1 Tax=Metarhizium rileyi (strain RCEF 4871) TaxID=1649241 RepID=A0A5C6GLA8_METRR|nr:hypothetical protein ED733_007276 [Metarhizium rileyi]
MGDNIGALDDFELKFKSSTPRKRQGIINGNGKGQKQANIRDQLSARKLELKKDSNLSENGHIGVPKEAANSAEKTPIQEPATSDAQSTVPDPGSEPQRQSRPRISQLDDDFVYRKNLGIGALGKPVDAIIIKNPNKLKDAKKKPSRNVKPALPVGGSGGHFTWQDTIPRKPEVDESGFSEEIWGNIEEMRPKDTTILRRKNFDKLIRSLAGGFTADQLTAYANRANWDNTSNYATEHQYSWLINQSPWAAAEPFDFKSYKGKQRFAVVILTEAWKLEIQEHIEGIGRTVVWLEPSLFSLVANPQSGILERLSAELLDKSNNEGIMSRAEDHRLSIYGRKSAVATILARLDDIVQTVKSQTISVQHVEPDNLDIPVLRELGKTTKTALRLNTASSTLDVSWLPETDFSNGRTESPADIVLRLLIGRETSSQQTDAQFFRQDHSGRGLCLVHQREKRSMAWRDRLGTWYRHVKPIGGLAEDITKCLDLPANVQLTKPRSTYPNENIEVTATFGHILHSQKAVTQTKLSQTRRVLSPVIPHPAALTLITANAPTPSTQKTAIVLNFAPESTSASSPNIAPHIRLRLPITPFTDLSNFSFPDTSVLEAVIPWQESDIMLPGESVDVRLTQKRLIPLDAKQASLQEFLQSSEFSLLQGRLRTPSRTSFAIPERLAAKQSRSSTRQVAVPYMFMGLEIHQTIDMEWHSHTLRYSSIEAGQHGGQQQILSLIAGPPNGQDGVKKEGQVRSFLKLVEETACGSHFSWNEGYKLMSERSVEQFSWDMMDTEYAEQDPTTAKGQGAEVSCEGQEESGSLDEALDTAEADSKVKGEGEDDSGVSLDEVSGEAEYASDKQ